MRIIKNIAIVALGSLLVGSCVRENEEIVPKQEASGPGGNATLRVHPQYHDEDLSDARVFIRYNSTEFFVDTVDYDTAITVTVLNGRPTAVFPNLKPGDYYIHAIGTNTTLGTEKWNTYGGAPFKIIDTFARTYELNLHITNPYLEWLYYSQQNP